MKAFWRAGGGAWGGREFAMFQICPQGAMSAFLDNTPVEGRQVASTFHSFCSGFTSFIISYHRKSVWGNMNKGNHAPATSGSGLVGRTRQSPRSATRQDACLLPTVEKNKKFLHETLAAVLLVSGQKFADAEFFKSVFIAATSMRQKSIWLHFYWRERQKISTTDLSC